MHVSASGSAIAEGRADVNRPTAFHLAAVRVARVVVPRGVTNHCWLWERKKMRQRVGRD